MQKIRVRIGKKNSVFCSEKKPFFLPFGGLNFGGLNFWNFGGLNFGGLNFRDFGGLIRPRGS